MVEKGEIFVTHRWSGNLAVPWRMSRKCWVAQCGCGGKSYPGLVRRGEFVCLFVCLLSFEAVLWHMELLGQGSNPSHTCWDLASGNAGSLTHPYAGWDWTCILVLQTCRWSCCTTEGTPKRRVGPSKGLCRDCQECWEDSLEGRLHTCVSVTAASSQPLVLSLQNLPSSAPRLPTNRELLKAVSNSPGRRKCSCLSGAPEFVC